MDAESTASLKSWPSVSVVVPVRDDAENLANSVVSVLEQDYPGALDVVVAVGPSTDGTVHVAAGLADEHDRVTAVPNPSGMTATGVNTGVRAASGEWLLFASSHTRLAPDYVRRAVEIARATGADAVGGRLEADGQTAFERAVGAAMASPVAGANTAFRRNRPAGPSDTVALAMFTREIFDRVGGFADDLLRNQDYEFNWRVREQGGLVYYDPDLRVHYRPRGSLRRVARQYFDFGRWKREVVRRHPKSLRLRQLAAPVALLANLSAAVLALGWHPAFAAVPAAYAAGLVAAGVAAFRRGVGTFALVPVILATMHAAWGVGFIVGPPRTALGADAGGALTRDGAPSTRDRG